MKNYDKSIEYYTQALKIKSNLNPNDHKSILKLYENLDNIYKVSNNLCKSDECVKQILILRKKLKEHY